MHSEQGEYKYSTIHSKLRHYMQMNSKLLFQTAIPPRMNPGFLRMGSCVGPRASQHVSLEERQFSCPSCV